MSIVTTVTQTAYEIDWAALAAGVEKLVLEKLQDDLEHWEGDVSMKSMFVQDAADGLAVCETMIDAQTWHKVEKRIGDMDTAARDCVYDFIAIVAGDEFFDIVRV